MSVVQIWRMISSVWRGISFSECGRFGGDTGCMGNRDGEEGEGQETAKRRKLRPWTKEDVRMLKALAREKTKTGVIARKLKRSERATYQKALALSVTLGGGREEGGVTLFDGRNSKPDPLTCRRARARQGQALTGGREETASHDKALRATAARVGGRGGRMLAARVEQKNWHHMGRKREQNHQRASRSVGSSEMCTYARK